MGDERRAMNKNNDAGKIIMNHPITQSPIIQSPISNLQSPISHYPISNLQSLLILLALFLLTACGEAAEAAPATPTAGIVIETSAPLAVADAQPPVRLQIPALALDVAVEPMAWQVTEFQGKRRAVWQVPMEEAGWHLNSAPVGALGNLVISGHHLQGGAVFAALARGEVTVGQTIQVTDAQGRIFAYTVTEVSAPIPALAATAQDAAQAAAYLAQPATPAPDTAQLTLATGWPEFSDTHYIFVVARLVGELGN